MSAAHETDASLLAMDMVAIWAIAIPAKVPLTVAVVVTWSTAEASEQTLFFSLAPSDRVGLPSACHDLACPSPFPATACPCPCFANKIHLFGHSFLFLFRRDFVHPCCCLSHSLSASLSTAAGADMAFVALAAAAMAAAIARADIPVDVDAMNVATATTDFAAANYVAAVVAAVLVPHPPTQGLTV